MVVVGQKARRRLSPRLPAAKAIKVILMFIPVRSTGGGLCEQETGHNVSVMRRGSRLYNGPRLLLGRVSLLPSTGGFLRPYEGTGPLGRGDF